MDNTAPIQIDRRARLLAFLLLALLHSACSTLNNPSVENEVTTTKTTSQPSIRSDVPKRFVAERTMVNDLLSAAVQILPPYATTIQISSSNDNDLTLLVADAMARAGYGIQTVTADQGLSLLSTDIRTEEQLDSRSPIKHLRIDIGQVSIGRAYSLTTDRTIQPNSPFQLYGSRAPIEQDKTLFGATSTMASTEYLASIKIDEQTPKPLISLVTPDVFKSAAGEISNTPESTSINSAKVEINNLHFGESIFGSMLNDHMTIDDLIVWFPDDSTLLRNENKLLIRRFMDVFIEQLDLVSVIGCSNGPTASDLGNAGLALGRGERVIDELLSFGIPRDKILDQGCWAPSAGDKYPGRAVVLELWREKV